MDDRDLNRLRGLEQDLNQKLEVAWTQGDLTALEFLKGIEECRAKIADLIRPSDWTTIPDLGWSNARTGLQAVWQSGDSKMEGCLLPRCRKLQAIRFCIESTAGLMFRPFFRKKIFGIGAKNVHTGKKMVYGLTGPQGLGKSVFLHCLAIKRSSDNLVVWIPFYPSEEELFKDVLATVFYSGCQARNSIHEVLILDL